MVAIQQGLDGPENGYRHRFSPKALPEKMQNVRLRLANNTKRRTRRRRMDPLTSMPSGALEPLTERSVS
eukprot:scaffold175_cov153-Cylindrotheca_fusiformis.AAC.8